MKTSLSRLSGLLALGLLPVACSTPPMFDQGSVPAAVRVPDGHRVAMHTVGKGEITYECKEKAGMAGQFEWTFIGPAAVLSDRAGMTVGKYWGPPATWESTDGSKVTATQVAVSPGGSGNIPLQLVKANPAMGTGAMQGTTYIQRLDTRGGTAPALPCTSAQTGQRQIVKYQADYLFWKAA